MTHDSCAGSWSTTEVQFLVRSTAEVVPVRLDKVSCSRDEKLSQTANTVASVKRVVPVTKKHLFRATYKIRSRRRLVM